MDRVDRRPRWRMPPETQAALRSPGASLRRFPGRFGRLAEQELADEVLEHHRRLGQAQAVAVLQHHAVASGLEPDVLLAAESRGVDLGGRVARKLLSGVAVDGGERLVAGIVDAVVGAPA